jgi:hypothetical protein
LLAIARAAATAGTLAACTACGVLSPEEQLLTEFFEASRVFDTSVMSRLAATPLNPRTHGIVDSFEIAGVDRDSNGRERVTVDARVRTFEGRVSSRQLVFTLTRLDGRWFIQEWRGAP